MYEMIFTSPITTDPASVVCQPCFVKNITIETDHIPFPSIRYQWSTHPLCASLACLLPPRYPLLWGWSQQKVADQSKSEFGKHFEKKTRIDAAGLQRICCQ